MVDLCIVIVVYKRDFDKTESFCSIVNSLELNKSIRGHIIIYDNSPTSQLVTENQLNLHYYHDPRNIGVIPAYRYAINYCKKKSISWLLRLDQDSTFDNTLLVKFDSFLKLENADMFSAVVPKILCNNHIISPSIIRFAGLYKCINPKLCGICHQKLTFINSMSFINVNNERVVKAIENCIFGLDLSDHDVAYNLSIGDVYILDVFVRHSLSISEKEYVSEDRYIRILEAEHTFAKRHYKFPELLIFKGRLFFRSFKNLVMGRKRIALITIKGLFEI